MVPAVDLPKADREQGDRKITDLVILIQDRLLRICRFRAS